MALPQRRGKAPASLDSGKAMQQRSQLGPGGRKGVAKPAKRKPVSLKNQIRGLERLLRKVCSCIMIAKFAARVRCILLLVASCTPNAHSLLL